MILLSIVFTTRTVTFMGKFSGGSWAGRASSKQHIKDTCSQGGQKQTNREGGDLECPGLLLVCQKATEISSVSGSVGRRWHFTLAGGLGD